MTDLSPDTQAVLNAAEDAYGYNYSEFYCCANRVAAAALRAAAGQLAYGHGSWAGTSAIIDEDKLLAIAAELEGVSNEN